MSSFQTDYFILVFIGSLGVIQAAASVGGLRGLLIVKRPAAARAIGVALAIGAMMWFFTEPRIINDTDGGMNSNQQGLTFFIAAVCAAAATLAASTLVNIRMGAPDSPDRLDAPSAPPAPNRSDALDAPGASGASGAPPECGLDALRSRCWGRAVVRGGSSGGFARMNLGRRG